MAKAYAPRMKHICMFSGGIGSWATAKRVVEKHGPEDVTLLFTDTLIEDDDLYRFLDEAAANVGAELVRIQEGRDPWEVFRDVRFIGNTRADPCSLHLKRVPLDNWLEENCDPAKTICYIGIDFTEEHRFTRLRKRKAEQGWTYEAPLCEPPYMMKPAMLEWLVEEGIEPPRLYSQGFAHNNCGGFCIKSGHGNFANLLKHHPERYAHHEAKELEMREYLDADVAILRDRRGGETVPMTMKTFRERIEAGHQPDLFDIGGCGCMVDDHG
tara:strand:+ start:2489 stop:3295 length:807 start_codon:yes stop_codon:yes gene_type:complete